MKTATPRVTSKPMTRATNGGTWERASTAKSSTKSPDPSPKAATPRSSSAIPIRQSTPTRRATGNRAGTPREGNGASQGNSPSNGATRSSSVSKVSPTISKESSATMPHRSKQILNHDFLSKTPKNRGPSMLGRSIDDPSAIHQLRRHSVPLSKVHDYMSRSYDHGSLISLKSNDRGSNFMSRSQDHGPKFLSKSQNQGPRSLSKSQDRGLMSRSQDRGSLTSYTKFQSTGPRKLTVPEYGYDGRRLSTGSKETVQQTPRVSTAMQNALRGDRGSIHLQMGRSVDSTVSLSTAASSPSDRGRGGHQSFMDPYERRLTPLQLSQSQEYRSGDITPEDTSPLDARAPTRGGTKHRQLKSPDFFDVKKLNGDCGVITAVSRMHNKANGVRPKASEEDHDIIPDKHLHSEAFYENRRDSLAGSARKAFSVESDSADGSSHSSEINYKLDKELSGANDLLDIGSWNDDDEEYLRIYKLHDRSADGSFVDILEDTASESAAVGKNNHVEGTNTSSGRKKWGEFSKNSVVSNHDGGLYRKSNTGSELDTSTQPSPQESPPRGSPPPKGISATNTDAVSRISSTSATSIDLNRSTDTTCSTHSQYDNTFWSDPPINGNFRPWNPTREAEMTPAVVAARSLPMEEFVPPQAAAVLGSQGPADNFALSEKRALRYDDGLERLTSYMKNASQSARKKRGLSDDLTSQTSGCFDYLVDFLETQTSLADVLVSAHGESRKADFGGLATGTDKADFANAKAIRRVDSNPTNDTGLLSNRSMESRITDLGSEASWESGKSRSVQTLGTTGRVMDQITEKVDSLSFDSPKHLSTFKFGLKKTTVGAFETITSSEDQGRQSKADGRQEMSAPSSRATSERSFPLHKMSAQLSTPQSPISSWRSHTAPNSHKTSRNPSRNPSCNPSPSQSKRTHSGNFGIAFSSFNQFL